MFDWVTHSPFYIVTRVTLLKHKMFSFTWTLHINRSFIDPPSKMQASRIIWDLRNTSESLGSLNIQDPNFWLSLSCVSTHTLYFLLWHNSLECLSMMVNAVTLWILSVYISILVTIQHYWGFSKFILYTHTYIYIYM